MMARGQLTLREFVLGFPTFMNRTPHVAVVGATGAVGLEREIFPWANSRCSLPPAPWASH